MLLQNYGDVESHGGYEGTARRQNGLWARGLIDLEDGLCSARRERSEGARRVRSVPGAQTVPDPT